MERIYIQMNYFSKLMLLRLFILFLCCYITVGQHDVDSGKLYVSNLNATCLRCLCVAATACTAPGNGCENEYCGPFYISRIYWVDAEKYVLKNDNKNRDKAWEDCAKDYNCGAEIVTRYMKKFGKDCNKNGVTDCDDYASIHYNGGYNCEAPMTGTPFYRRYNECKSTQLG